LTHFAGLRYGLAAISSFAITFGGLFGLESGFIS